MRNDKRWFIQLCDDICHRKCLARTGDAKKCLALIALLEALHKLCNCLGLVTGWGIF